MYIIIYEFHVKKGHIVTFRKAWSTITQAIMRCQNSLGSRLHTTQTPGVYLAYAQWPDQETYEKPLDMERLTHKEKEARDDLEKSCESMAVLNFMTVVDDQLC